MNKRFIAVRYFMVPVAEENLFFKPLTAEERKQLFIKAFLQNKDYTTKKGVRLVIRGVHNEGNLYFGKLAKLKKLTFDEDIQIDLQKQEQDGYFTIRFICNINNQMLVLETNSFFESDLNQIIKWLEAIVNSVTLEYDYKVSFRAIVPENNFWNVIENAESIYSIDLVLESPNLFEGQTKAEEGLKTWKSLFNQNTATVKLENKKGRLKVPRDILATYIRYADQGGGHWVAKVKDKLTKNKKRVNSAQFAASTYVNLEDIPEDEGLKIALTNLEEFNNYPKSEE